ncbi:MAG TPA: replicative DNA helicase, partial [Fimbriimonadaceae bacterium]|nr:replicative DNA helicase [Fimbriimonadaceae bacterium]
MEVRRPVPLWTAATRRRFVLPGLPGCVRRSAFGVRRSDKVISPFHLHHPPHLPVPKMGKTRRYSACFSGPHKLVFTDRTMTRPPPGDGAPPHVLTAEELVPLHSIEMEMSVLGSMILSDRAAEEIVTLLEDGDFYRPAHKEIFRAIRQLVNNSRPIDFVTLKDELIARDKLGQVGGLEYLMQIAEFVPSAANATYYAQVVLDKATLRRLENAGRDIIGAVHEADEASADDKVDRAEQLVFEVGRRRLGSQFRHVSSLAKEFFIDVDNIIESGEPLVGITSGFSDLDKMTTGFYGGDL